MNSIALDDTKITSAASWNELNKKQLLYIAECWPSLILAARINAAIDVIRIRMLMVLFKIQRWNIFSKKRRLFLKVNDEQLLDLLNAHGFLFKEISLTKQLIKAFRIRLTRFYGPGDNLKHVTFGEFCLADTYYRKHVSSGDDAYLDRMIAVLYRPQKKNYESGDIREPLNDSLIEYRSKLMHRLPYKYKQAIVFYYVGCLNGLKNVYPTILAGEGGKKSKADKFGMGGVLLSIAGGKFGDLEKTEQTLLHNVLMDLEITALQNIKK